MEFIPMATMVDTIRMEKAHGTSSIGMNSIISQTRTRGHTMTTGVTNRQLLVVWVVTLADFTGLADLAAGLRELTVLAVGEACAQADSAAFMASAGSTGGGVSP